MKNDATTLAGDPAQKAFIDSLPERFGPARRTLPAILNEQAERYGDRRLAVFGEESWTYAETHDRAGKAGALLASAGITNGDRVAIFCSNRSEFLAIFLGCAWIGAVMVPINTASRGAQLRHVLANCGARLLVVEAEIASAFDDVPDAFTDIETIWTIGGEANSVGGKPSSPLPAFPAAIPAHAVRPGDTLAILYTSGTTGPAKGVCCPQAQFFWWGVGTARGLGMREGDVLLTTLPLFHTNALNCFWQALLTGSTYVLEPKFSASGYWKAVGRHKATIGYFLGAMAAILLSRPSEDADLAHSMRTALGGGVPERFHKPFLERFGVPLLDAYGSTETNFVFASDIPSAKPGTMGFLCHGFEARIVDEGDVEVADGKAGELVLRADDPFAFATGYFGMPDKTVEAWQNLWFHTGDRVSRDPDGNFRFIDRMKDAIRRRGENISSWEVEQVLLSHPAIASCAVYAVPSELGEDEVMAALLPEPGMVLDPVEIMGFCESRLAYFAVPRFLDVVTALPLTENGKIRKVMLRQAGITPNAWDREAAGYKLRRLYRQDRIMDELHDAGLVEIGDLIAAGEVSSVEVTRHQLARCEALGHLNALITLTADLALAQAEAADREIAAAGRKSVLHGVPVALKDLYDLKGIPTTAGMPHRHDTVATSNATVTQRLIDAGAVILGKTCLTEGAYAEHRQPYGAPLNPWNADRWCGASSSGSAVGVAAGLFFAGLATETGGSIRIPSAMNGVTGFKPTWGRVSRAGIYELAGSLDHVGPIARSAADAAAVLGIIAGRDPADPTSSRHPVENYLAEAGRSLAGVRIGIDMAFSESGTDPEHVAAMLAAAQTLRDLGAELVDIKLPDSSQIIWDWFDVCAAQNALVNGALIDETPGTLGPSLTALVARGRALKGTDYQTVINRRDAFRGDFEALFADIDLVLSPAMAFTPPTNAMMENFTDDLISGIHRFTCPFTMSGHPVLSMPGGMHTDGMPINVQIVGPLFGEALLARAGMAWQSATRWHRRRPRLKDDLETKTIKATAWE